MHNQLLSFVFSGSLAICAVATAENRVIPIYDGKPSGSESWGYSEQLSTNNVWQTPLAYNVSEPTMEQFLPAKPNGTAVIVCPGGGFHCLSIESEGNQVAEWLVEKGITCFVLKYRTVECKTTDPGLELLNKATWPREEIDAIVRLATDDGLRAVSYVREHAKELSLDANRIGMIGFSAGGTLVVSAATHFESASRPDFVAPIYAQYDWAMKNEQVREDAPPLFIACATNDQLGLAAHSIRIYQDWTAAKKSAELHLYAKGGHGFGMRKQNLPSDEWTEPLYAWMKTEGFVPR